MSIIYRKRERGKIKEADEYISILFNFNRRTMAGDSTFFANAQETGGAKAHGPKRVYVMIIR
jgi:hypothetical protein